MMKPSIDIIIGPMFSGKSTELLRILNTYAAMDVKVLYINSELDTRSNNNFSTHNPMLTNIGKIESCKLSDLNKIYDLDLDNYSIIGIDEAQFFNNLKNIVIDLVEKDNKKILVAGLNGDYCRQPFGEILDLIPYCDNITKLNTFCQSCGDNFTPGLFTKRIIKNNNNTILIGKQESYIPTCRKCYHK